MNYHSSLASLCLMMDEDNNIISSIMTGKKSVIIWGATFVCAQLIRCLREQLPHTQVSVWDVERTGSSIEDVSISSPDVESIGQEQKNQTVVLLAFNKPIHHEVCIRRLKANGYTDIENAQMVLNCLAAQKIRIDCEAFRSFESRDGFIYDENRLELYANDLYGDAGTRFDNEYLNQDLWAAKKIFSARPSVHYDIGSRVDGFITHLLAFGQKTVLIDVRPLDTCGMENVTFLCADATSLKNIPDESLASLSALCSIEHFGLGRYGDPLDANAHVKAFTNIQRVLKKGGNLYISLPVSGENALVFNAHRIFSPIYVINMFSSLTLVEFSIVMRPEGLIQDYPAQMLSHEACGLFHFRK